MRKIRFIAVLLILCMMTAVIPQVMSAEENAEAYYGDVNFDGKISTLDAALILKFSASMIIFTVDKELALTGEGFMKADANKDGQVNTADAAFVLKVCAGMISPNAVADGNAEYVITYSSGSISESAATVPAPQTVKAGETFVIMTVAVAQGHEFLGWLADFDGLMYTVGGSFVMPAQDVTLTARWDNESAPTPTSQPTNEPTQQPTGEPTQQPTDEPTQQPTGEPTQQPTDEPTQQPTGEPTQQPTSTPTQQPTSTPVPTPTQIPIPDPHNWDGVWDAGQKPRGSGTVVDPYVIYLPEELVWMAYNTAQHDPDGDGMTGMAEAWSYNQHFKLGRDIVLNEQVLDENGNLLTGVTLNEWRGIGYENGWGDVRFCGEFNGDGHTIYGLYTTKQYCSWPEISDTKYSGFFISLGDSANVHDVNFVDAYVGSQSTYYTGGAVAYTESNVTVANITYQGFVQGGDSTASIGGILGRIETQNGMVQIMNCKFSGTVRGYRCGTTMDYCGGVGGILGTASLALAPAKEVWIDGCESSGKVAFSLGVMNTSTPYAALGGIAGKLRVEGATITNCRSDALITVPGEVTSSTDGGFINLGGILGYAHTGAISVKSCAFKGHVYGSYYGLGGIVGNSVSTGTTYLSIENCYNVGTIENFHGDSWKTVKFMGGIIGKASENVTITNCYNAGEMKVKVTSASYKTIGEISYQGLGSISNCYYLVGNTDCTITDSSKVHPKTAEEFMTLAASLGNEFVDDAESGRPVLKWELGKNAVDNPW